MGRSILHSMAELSSLFIELIHLSSTWGVCLFSLGACASLLLSSQTVAIVLLALCLTLALICAIISCHTMQNNN